MSINIGNYLDSTYLKTPEQSGLTASETEKKVRQLIQECINEDFVLAMIRPQYVSLGREMVDAIGSKVKIGTVIGFHEGTAKLEDKIIEAQKAINDGVDELDYVINYQKFLKGDTETVKKEVLHGTKLGLDNHKIVKWIIEIAALNNLQIAEITTLIKNIVTENFPLEQWKNVYVKSSTGFFETTDGKPNGATFEAMQIIKQNAGGLSIKAAGGVRNYNEAVKMIELGVNRIGTSSAKIIADGADAKEGY